MLTRYIQTAMNRVKWEILPDNSFYASIPELPGIYAQSSKLEDCLRELQAVLEEWIVLGIASRAQLPAIDGIEIKLKDNI